MEVNRLDISGKRFGVLTVMDFSHVKGNKTYWLCKCDCGKDVVCLGSQLISGHIIGHKCYLTNGLLDGGAAKNRLIDSYKRSANKRNLIWQLSYDEVTKLFSGNCYYCGSTPFNLQKSSNNKRKEYIYNGIDRVDNTRGYELDNVVSCCKVCNRAKRDMPYQDFIDWLDQIVNFKQKNQISKGMIA